MDILENTRQKLIYIMEQENWGEEGIAVVSEQPLSPMEATSELDRNDLPISKGKEFMIEAAFRGAAGQAFTDQPGFYNGTLREVTMLPLTDDFHRAVFIASTNAVLRSMGLLEKSVHCKDLEPVECAKKLALKINGQFGQPKIAFIGYQPGMVDELAKMFEMRVVDLDPDNIGRRFGNVVVEDAIMTNDILDWSDIVLATGSTATNGTMTTFMIDKPTIFYGITIAGIACLNALDVYCPGGH